MVDPRPDSSVSVTDRDQLTAAAQRYGLDPALLVALAILGAARCGPGSLCLGITAIDPGQQLLVESHQAAAAARLIRDRIDQLIRSWDAPEFWLGATYSDRFLTEIAAGIILAPTGSAAQSLLAPPGNPPAKSLVHVAANSADTVPIDCPVQLQPCDPAALIAAYRAETIDRPSLESQAECPLDDRLLDYLQRLPRFYRGFVFQREALIEAICIWHLGASRADVIDQLSLDGGDLDPLSRDHALLGFIPALIAAYRGYPHQRQALILVVQRSLQLPSIEAALEAMLQGRSPQVDLGVLDPVLMAFVQQIPSHYRASADQRNALVEGFAQWHGIQNQREVLLSLGIGTELLQVAAEGGQASPTAIAQAAQQLDQALLSFSRQLPGLYQGQDRQRQALIQVIRHWTGSPSTSAVIDQLLHDLRRMEQGATIRSAAPPPPQPLGQPSPPPAWTPSTLQLFATPSPGCPYSWADITQGGRHWPADQATVDRMIALARHLNLLCDRLGVRPHITRWYDPKGHHRHPYGDGMECYVEGILAEQLYWSLDPWWPGGLGCDRHLPYLLYLDHRGYRVRWHLNQP